MIQALQGDAVFAILGTISLMESNENTQNEYSKSACIIDDIFQQQIKDCFKQNFKNPFSYVSLEAPVTLQTHVVTLGIISTKEIVWMKTLTANSVDYQE